MDIICYHPATVTSLNTTFTSQYFTQNYLKLPPVPPPVKSLSLIPKSSLALPRWLFPFAAPLVYEYFFHQSGQFLGANTNSRPFHTNKIFVLFTEWGKAKLVSIKSAVDGLGWKWQEYFTSS